MQTGSHTSCLHWEQTFPLNIGRKCVPFLDDFWCAERKQTGNHIICLPCKMAENISNLVPSKAQEPVVRIDRVIILCKTFCDLLMKKMN